MSKRHALVACLIAGCLQACCTTIPVRDSTPPVVSMRLEDSTRSVWYRTEGGVFETDDDRVLVQFSVNEPGGIAEMELYTVLGVLEYEERLPVLELLDGDTRLLFIGNLRCAKDKINQVAFVRPAEGSEILQLNLRADNYAGLREDGTRSTALPPVAIDFR